MRERRNIYERFVEKIQFCEHGITCEKCCWPWIGSIYDNGYGQFPYSGGSRAHMFMCEWAWGSLNELYALHTCDNPPCVQPNHLWKGTHSDNMKDMFQKGHRSLRGEFNNNATLQVNEIHLIYTLRVQGLSHNLIAQHVHTSRENVRDILSGRRWHHIWKQYHETI